VDRRQFLRFAQTRCVAQRARKVATNGRSRTGHGKEMRKKSPPGGGLVLRAGDPEGSGGHRRHKRAKIDPRLERWGITVVPLWSRRTAESETT